MQLIRTNDEEKIKVLEGNPYFKELSSQILAEVISGMHLYNLKKMRLYSGKVMIALVCI